MTDETAALVARMNADALHSMRRRIGTGTYVSFRSSAVLALIAAYEASREEIEDMRASLDKISAEIYSTRAAYEAEKERADRINNKLGELNKIATEVADNADVDAAMTAALRTERDALAELLRRAGEALDQIADGEESLRLMNFGYIVDICKPILTDIEEKLKP